MSTERRQKRKDRRVLITGADGYIGRTLVATMAEDSDGFGEIVAMDVRPVAPADQRPGVTYVTADIRSPDLGQAVSRYRPDVVVHLAAVVTPGRKSNRAFEYSVDVLGTRNILEACVATGVDQFIVTSSGAAYGYYPDNPEWIDETDPVRGNPEFAYSDHKRQVEEMLARWRDRHPELKQLVFRPGTVLGATTRNQITNLFDRRVVIGLWGVDSPFVIIWDRDVVGAIIEGIRERREGIFNLAGDGSLTLRQMAGMMDKPYVPLPVPLVSVALALLKRLGLTQYGPEQLNFIRYRPVLSNRRLKEEFGYTPEKTTREVFGYFLECRRNGS